MWGDFIGVSVLRSRPHAVFFGFFRNGHPHMWQCWCTASAHPHTVRISVFVLRKAGVFCCGASGFSFVAALVSCMWGRWEGTSSQAGANPVLVKARAQLWLTVCGRNCGARNLAAPSLGWLNAGALQESVHHSLCVELLHWWMHSECLGWQR